MAHCLPPWSSAQAAEDASIFFKMPKGVDIKNSSRKLGPGIDTRGTGGYVLVPPSGHPSGGTYQWTSNGTPPADAPQWLLELLTKPKQQGKSEQKARPATGRGTTAYGRQALEDECAGVSITAAGGRNDALNQAACKLGHLVAGGEIDEQDAWSGLLDAALMCGLPEWEARKTIASGLNKGSEEPKQAPPRSEKNHSCPSSGDDADDEKCVPIPLEEYPAPKIPAKLFPGWIRDYALAVAEEVQVPFELALCHILGGLSVAATKKFIVYVNKKQSHIDVNVWILAPLDTGERKSATMKKGCRVILEIQQEKRAEFVKKKEHIKNEIDVLKRVIT